MRVSADQAPRRSAAAVPLSAAFMLCMMLGCDDGGAAVQDGPAIEVDARVPPGQDAAAKAEPEPDAGRGPTIPKRAECDAERPIPATELQSRAIGSSVFGRVTGGDAGLFDPYGMTECGLPATTICVAGSTTCTESDAAGQFVLSGLPENVPIELTFERTGFRSLLRLVELGTTPIDLHESRLITAATSKALIESAGVHLDQALGSVVAVGVTAGEAIGGIVLAGDATITLEPDHLTPLYSAGETDSSGLSSDVLDPSLTQTKVGGWGLFLNLKAGEYSVHFERDAVQCLPFVAGYGFGSDDHGDIVVKVRDGFTTSMAAYCP